MISFNPKRTVKKFMKVSRIFSCFRMIKKIPVEFPTKQKIYFLHSSDPSYKLDKGVDHCSSLKLFHLLVIFT